MRNKFCVPCRDLRHSWLYKTCLLSQYCRVHSPTHFMLNRERERERDSIFFITFFHAPHALLLTHTHPGTFSLQWYVNAHTPHTHTPSLSLFPFFIQGKMSPKVSVWCSEHLKFQEFLTLKNSTNVSHPTPQFIIKPNAAF